MFSWEVPLCWSEKVVELDKGLTGNTAQSCLLNKDLAPRLWTSHQINPGLRAIDSEWGKAHTEDIRKVIEFVSQKSPKPIFLMGHSRGTISVAHLAVTVKDERIRGAVLAGSKVNRGRDSQLGGGSGLSLADLPLENINYLTLFVHHRDDGCGDIQAAREQRKRVINSSSVIFIEVLGGNSPPGHDPCSGGNNPHTFMGTEKEVIKVIADWASGNPVPERIGQ